MDYSGLPTETGSSPWATSPQHNSTGLYTSGADFPSTPPRHTSHSGDGDGDGDENDYADTHDASLEDSGETREGVQTKQHAGANEQVTAPATDGQEQQPHQTEDRSHPQRDHTSARTNQRRSVPQYKLQAKITGLERTGRKDPILRFDVVTNLPRFRTSQFRDVRRTHSEFVKLADHLISYNPEAFVPAVPSPLTAAGAGTDEDEVRVRSSLQRWLDCVCGNEVLMRDEEMILFVESDFGYSPVVRRKQPATGVRRRVIKQFAPPPDDTPELQEARPIVKLFYLGTMEAGQKVDKVVKARRNLGMAETELGVKFGNMHVQETHPGLRNAYRKLGKTLQTTGDYHRAQGTAEATTIGDPLQYHSSDAFIVKETLTNRHILIRDLIQAQQATYSRHAAADRLKASNSVKRDKADETLDALTQAQSAESRLSEKTQRVTANLLQEKRRWFARTAADMRTSIREYVLREIEAERRTLATLEAVRPDIRAIDASGGLSRLGRESHPAARRASLAASQGPKGDSWSGVQRRPDGLNRSVTGGLPNLAEEQAEEGADGEGAPPTGRVRSGSLSSSRGPDGLKEEEEDDDDRIDARNAASRLATSTF